MTDGMETQRNITTFDLYALLNFDDTLISLAALPDGITIFNKQPNLRLRIYAQLARRLGFVFGREIAARECSLAGFPEEISAAHGAAARRDGTLSRYTLVGSAVVDRIRQHVIDNTPGFSVEAKDEGAVICYRAASDTLDLAPATADQITAVAARMEERLSDMALETEPSYVNKACAVREIVAQQSVSMRPAVIGDNVTDEEVMVAAQKHVGLCARVGESDICTAYQLSDPLAMRSVLITWTHGGAT
jgi:trehalose 6-phosphate phosphatase